MSWLDEIGAEPWEIDAYLDVMAELDAGDLPPGEDYGLEDGYGLAGSLADLGRTIELAGTVEAQRRAEDIEDLTAGRRSDEARLARAVQRIERGSYLPAGMYRDREADGRFRSETACHAHRDAYGRCGARFHDAGCLEVFRGEAAAGSHDAALAWRRTLNEGSAVSGATLLANHTGTDWDEQLGEPGPGALEALAWMRGQLGVSGPQPLAGRPTAGDLARELGLR